TGTGFSAIDLKAAEEKSVTPGNQPTAPNSLSLSIEQNDVGYAATISMGSPPQEFSILMDSGSADFWVTGEKCQSSSVKGANCGNHTTLGPSSSSSFVDTRQIFQVLYGSGNVSGTKIIDDISIAGLSLPQHSFGATQKESFQFTGATFDGLMGVAQSTLSQQKVPTPVESLFTSGLIQEAIISFKISRLRDALNDGDVTFGGLDPNKFDQNTLVTLDNVNPQGFWEANFSSVTMNGKRLKVTGLSAILDTGTTLMVVPQDDALTIHQRIQGAKSDGKGGFTVPCTTNASLALTFGGQTFAIESTDLAFLPVDPNDLQGDCQSGITPSSINGLSTWLVGDVFLKNAYLSVNTNENTISLAKLT
ncbi:Aspartic peptidase domain containing protein, partial [Lactarius tabidus]